MADDERLEELGHVFASFAEESYRGKSPLYDALAKGVSEDRVLLQIASSARRPPVPNLLFAAVHYLLLGGAAGTLSSFYPSLTGEPRPASDAYPHFREFCFAHEGEIRGLMATRLVQTNEVARCAYMLPAFGLIAGETPGRALSLVDVGASAGLNLLWDRYSYVYGGRIRAGSASSPVVIETEVRGDREPPIPQKFPAVAFRVGIDLSPVDLTDAESALWLRALVWPEHEGRAAQLQAAISLAGDDPPALVGGRRTGCPPASPRPSAARVDALHIRRSRTEPVLARRPPQVQGHRRGVCGCQGRVLAIRRGPLGIRLRRARAGYSEGRR